MNIFYKNQIQDFNWALGLNRFSLRLMGIWPIDEDICSKPFNKLLRIPAMILIAFFCLFLPQMYALCLVINELPLVIDNLMTSCAAFTSCMKLFFIWRSEKDEKDKKKLIFDESRRLELLQNVDMYNQIILSNIFQVLEPVVRSLHHDWQRPRLPWQLAQMRREASRARLITIADYTVMASCYSGFVLAPLLGFDLRSFSNLTDYGGRSLLVQSYYPYDYSVSPVFEFTYLLQLLGSFFVGMAVSIPDDYFGALVFHTSGQFRILGKEIENFVRANKGMTENVDRMLGRFVKRHVQLVSIVSAIEKSFSFVIAPQIFCMSIMVCCLGFQILGMLNNIGDKPTPLQIVTLVGTLFTMMIHTFVNCFASETLALRSSKIFFNIYSSKWYMLPRNKSRCLIPMMVMSRTPRQIKAGKLFHLSMATYCSIIKSTAGYISMLIAVSGR